MRIAVAGTGYFSQFHFDAWRRLGHDVVGVCDLDLARATERAESFPGARAFASFDEMLDRTHPDLVDIVTPPPTHLGFIEATMKRGLPTICQKPFTLDLDEARAAAEMSENAGTLLVVHENFRFQPWYGKIRDMIAAGDIGTLYQIAFRLRPGDGQGPEAYLDRQPYFQTMERFLIHETAIHIFDVFRFLGGEVDGVMAVLNTLNPAIKGEDAGIVVLGLENGARALFDGNRLSDHIADNRRLTMGEMTVEGSAGTVRLDGDGGIHFRAFSTNAETRIDYAWTDAGYGGDCVYRLQRHVVDALKGGVAPMNTARAYLRNLEIEDAVYRANARGRRIAL